MPQSARETALKALIAQRRGGAWADGFLKDIVGRDGLDSRDAALAVRICYGVMQNRALLDHYIRQFCTTPLTKLQPVVLDILRIGAYQIVFMDRVPDSAAVNEAVASAKSHANIKASGLVNAVLRKVSTGPLNQPADLATLYSHPQWLVDALTESAGDRAGELLAANNSIPPTYAQVNTLKFSIQEAIDLLEADGAEVKKHPWQDGCLVLTRTGNIETLTAFRAGAIMIQDAGARLCVEAADPKPGMTVIDACAAPGGKSIAAAMMMQDRGSILACDIHEHKIKLIESAAERVGADCITAKVMDAKTPNPEFFDYADIVIADVPCSGLGVIRKKPDIRYKDKDTLGGLPPVQLQILKNICRYVKPGGVLLYSTCTLIKAENEYVVSQFLKENPMFEPSPFSLPCPEGEAESGMITLYPHIHDTDGFFICKMKRRPQ